MAELETQPGDEIFFPSQQSGQFCLQLMLGDNLGDTAKNYPSMMSVHGLLNMLKSISFLLVEVDLILQPLQLPLGI